MSDRFQKINLQSLQALVEAKLEEIEQILGPNYALTLIASHNGAQGLKDADIILTMADRDAIMKAIDKLLPKSATLPIIEGGG